MLIFSPGRGSRPVSKPSSIARVVSTKSEQQPQAEANGGAAPAELMDKERLSTLAKSVDELIVLDEGVADAVLALLDDFVDGVVTTSTELSRHRVSKRLEAKDVRFALSRRFDVTLPPSDAASLVGSGGGGAGGANAVATPAKRPALAHQQRMALIDKTLKKL